MSELQTEVQDDLPIEDIQPEQGVEQTGTVENGSNSALDSDGQHEEQGQESSEPKVEQYIVQNAVNKKHFQMKEQERRADALEAQLKELQSQQQQQAVPVVPEMPDQFDDNYESKMAEREKAIRAVATYEASQTLIQQQQQQQQQLAQQQQAEKLRNEVDSYTQRATAVGISQPELQQAGNTVAAYGMRDEHVMAILNDNDGPLITKYLAGNPAEIENINTMNSYQLAIHIERKIRPEASKFKPKTSSAPAPAADLQGNGVDPDAGKYPNSGGATFT